MPPRTIGAATAIVGCRRPVGHHRRHDRGDSSAATALAQKADAQEITELDVGSDVDGRYRIVELIGEGGMGKVYLAEHVEIGKRVALKVLHPSYSRMPDLVERFRREARAASKIGHPNIVDVTDSGSTADGSVYFVMEYLEGVELGSVIEREGALDTARALRITGQICRALTAAHREGIIHRDLKPENIFLITRGGEADIVKVLDFGIAKTTEAEAARERRLTSPGMAMGTPEYMAPEQAAGRPADARTDIYSLGAIMYEMVTGLPPYQGDNFMEILTKKATLDPPAPITVRTELPLTVSELVMAAMARNPDERPQTMDALEYELNKCLAGRGIAVAQILGMTTDANVVASLNPGLSMRNLDDGIVRPQTGVGRAGTHSGVSEIWETRSGVSRALGGGNLSGAIARAQSEPSPSSSGTHRAMSSGPNSFPRAGTPAPTRASSNDDRSPASVRGAVVGDTIAQDATPLPAQTKKSGAAVFGWVLLVLVLVGGGGGLAYMMLLQNADKHDGMSSNVGNVGSAPDEHGNPIVAVGSGSADPAVGSANVGSANVGSANVGSANVGSAGSGSAGGIVEPVGSDAGAGSADPKTTKPVPPNTGRPKVPIVRHLATAAEDKDPKALIKAASAAEASSDWETVKSANQKLEKIKPWAGPAVYGQAWAAFQMNDTPAALTLSQRAIKLPGPQRTKAMFLYADTLFKQGDAKRAKDFYLNLRGMLADKELKATATKKIALCNRQLKLPERDGITGD